MMRALGFAASVAWAVVTAAAEVCRRHELRAFHRRDRAYAARYPGR